MVVLPESWKFYTFDQLFRVVPIQQYSILSSQIRPFGRTPVVDQSKKYIAGYSNSPNIFKNHNCIVFGDHTRISKYIDFDFIVGADGVQVLIPRSFDTKFLAYYVSKIEIPDTGYNRHLKYLKDYTYVIPFSVKEQKLIAATLSSFDEHIKNLTKLIEKKKAIRDGALEDLVTGKTRLDGFEDGWEICRIETLTKQIITGGTPSTSEDKYWGGAIPWLSSTEIHQKRIMNPTSYITESGLKNSSAKMAPPCSVIVALAGQGKTRGTVAVLEREMALNQSLAAMVANDNTDFMFLYYALENGYEDLRELSSGDGGRGGLNKKILRDFEVKVPPCKDEQQAIASILTAMDEEINSLEQEKNKIAQLKEGAMDDLLTGRVRLV
ncbi:MAG: restriction endonuclease subunit S [Fastidiosipilaceae bacterium]|jgi:restriction endonuclease S subunit